MEKSNSFLYFQWPHKESSTFGTYLLPVHDSIYYSYLAFPFITFCSHPFFWRVYSTVKSVIEAQWANTAWTETGLPDDSLPQMSPEQQPSGLWGSRFSLWNFSLETWNWRDGGVEGEEGTWGPGISVPDEVQSSMKISLGSQNSATNWEYIWQVVSFS